MQTNRLRQARHEHRQNNRHPLNRIRPPLALPQQPIPRVLVSRDVRQQKSEELWLCEGQKILGHFEDAGNVVRAAVGGEEGFP